MRWRTTGHSVRHPPSEAVYERSVGGEFFDELAVMVDTFRPLEPGQAALTCEDPDYAWTLAGAEAPR